MAEGPHEQVIGEIIEVIDAGRTWDADISRAHAGGPPGDEDRPKTYPSGGSQNWPPIAWVGEGLGRLGFGTIDTWHRCSLGEETETNSIGLFNTEIGSSIYNRWAAGASSLAAIPDSRRRCARPPVATQELARRASAAYVAFFSLHAVAILPERIWFFREAEEERHERQPLQTRPWVIAAQNRGVAKLKQEGLTSDWPHAFNTNGRWLALALDWRPRERGGKRQPAPPPGGDTEWWLWAMEELAGLTYQDRWPAEWFGLQEEDRPRLRSFIESDGGEASEVIERLAGAAPVRREYTIKRWADRLISWIPRSSNGNNPAVLVAEWRNREASFYAPSHFYKGHGNPIDPGETWEADRRVMCRSDRDDIELESSLLPATDPLLHAAWSQARGLELIGEGGPPPPPPPPPPPHTACCRNLEAADGLCVEALGGEADTNVDLQAWNKLKNRFVQIRNTCPLAGPMLIHLESCEEILAGPPSEPAVNRIANRIQQMLRLQNC